MFDLSKKGTFLTEITCWTKRRACGWRRTRWACSTTSWTWTWRWRLFAMTKMTSSTSWTQWMMAKTSRQRKVESRMLRLLLTLATNSCLLFILFLFLVFILLLYSSINWCWFFKRFFYVVIFKLKFLLNWTC